MRATHGASRCCCRTRSPGDARNLSFEREFGKMIAYQDAMAQIAAQRTNRTIRRVVQTLATAVFLPI